MPFLLSYMYMYMYSLLGFELFGFTIDYCMYMYMYFNWYCSLLKYSFDSKSTLYYIIIIVNTAKIISVISLTFNTHTVRFLWSILRSLTCTAVHVCNNYVQVIIITIIISLIAKTRLSIEVPMDWEWQNNYSRISRETSGLKFIMSHCCCHLVLNMIWVQLKLLLNILSY